MKKNYYSFEEIKTKFKNYRELKESNITDEEYDIFCDEIQLLPKEIVDKVHIGIKFVLLSANPKNVNPACYVNLKKGIEKEKEGIIVLTPFIFGAPYIDKNGKEIIIDRLKQPCILHEVAHHILKHYVYKNQKDFEKKEKTAWQKAEKWFKNWASRDSE